MTDLNKGVVEFCGLFSFYAPVGHVGSAFYRLVEAIRLAVNQVNCLGKKFTHSLNLTGSKPKIQATCYSESPKQLNFGNVEFYTKS
jgi:hypothetical protein